MCEWTRDPYFGVGGDLIFSMSSPSSTNLIPTPRTCSGMLNLYIEAWAPEIRAMTRKCQPEMWPPWGRMNYERCDGTEEVCG